MPFTRERMGSDDFQIPLVADCPQSILDATSAETYGYAQVVITEGHHRVGLGGVDASDLQAMAMFCGVLVKNPNGGQEVEGEGLAYLLGSGGDGGDMYTGPDDTSAGKTMEDQLDDLFFTRSQGLTKGSVATGGTTRDIDYEPGTTALDFLETIISTYGGGNEYRINPEDFTIDVDDVDTLYDPTPSVVLSQEGGRDGVPTGLHCELEVPEKTIEDYRSVVVARNDAVVGSASNTVPTTFRAPDGSLIVDRALVSPNVRPFHERPRWPDRVAAAHYRAHMITATQQATNLATNVANKLAATQYEVSADIEEFAPTRLLLPGDHVWVHDLGLGLIDETNEIYYRGSAVHPKDIRLEAMTCPILEGYGVYLHRWDGAAMEYFDITPWVAFEDGPTTLELGWRSHLGRGRARPRPINRRRLRRYFTQMYLLDQYLQRAG